MLEVTGDSDQAGGGGKKWSDARYIFTADPQKVLMDRRWDTGGRRGIQDDLWGFYPSTFSWAGEPGE